MNVQKAHIIVELKVYVVLVVKDVEYFPATIHADLGTWGFLSPLYGIFF